MSSKHKGAIVITGAPTGVGRAASLMLDKRGYRVFASVRKEKDAEFLNKNSSENLTPIFMDITKVEEIKCTKRILMLKIKAATLKAYPMRECINNSHKFFSY